MSALVLNSIIISIAPIVICVVLVVLVWLRVRSDNKLGQENSELRDKQTSAIVMQVGEWGNASVNVVIGIFLGVAINGLVQLISMSLWSVVVLIVALAVVLFFLASWFDLLVEKIFPSGIDTASK